MAAVSPRISIIAVSKRSGRLEGNKERFAWMAVRVELHTVIHSVVSFATPALVQKHISCCTVHNSAAVGAWTITVNNKKKAAFVRQACRVGVQSS